MFANAHIKQVLFSHPLILLSPIALAWLNISMPSVLVHAIIKTSVRRDPDRPDSARFGPAAFRPRADGNRCRSAVRSIRTSCVKPARQKCAQYGRIYSRTQIRSGLKFRELRGMEQLRMRTSPCCHETSGQTSEQRDIMTT